MKNSPNYANCKYVKYKKGVPRHSLLLYLILSNIVLMRLLRTLFLTMRVLPEIGTCSCAVTV